MILDPKRQRRVLAAEHQSLRRRYAHAEAQRDAVLARMDEICERLLELDDEAADLAAEADR